MTAPDRSGSSDASANETALAVGVDVSKASLEVVILGKGADRSVSRSIPNTEDGFDKLRAWIDREVEVDFEEIHVCLEASGGYEQPVARYLHDQNLTAKGCESATHQRLR